MRPAIRAGQDRHKPCSAGQTCGQRRDELVGKGHLDHRCHRQEDGLAGRGDTIGVDVALGNSAVAPGAGLAIGEMLGSDGRGGTGEGERPEDECRQGDDADDRGSHLAWQADHGHDRTASSGAVRGRAEAFHTACRCAAAPDALSPPSTLSLNRHSNDPSRSHCGHHHAGLPISRAVYETADLGHVQPKPAHHVARSGVIFIDEVVVITLHQEVTSFFADDPVQHDPEMRRAVPDDLTDLV